HGCLPLSRFRDSLPPRHWRAARHRATEFIAPELVSICTRRRVCQAGDKGLAAAHSLSLRLEEQCHVLAFAQGGLVPGCPTVLEIRLIVGRTQDATEHAQPTSPAFDRRRPPLTALSLPSHMHSPRTAPRAPGRACGATAPATTRAAT